MLANPTYYMPPDRQAAVEQLLMEICGAIGSFVAQIAERNEAGYDRASGESDATWEPAGITMRPAITDLGAVLYGHHLRAGRALLDWSMSDLAKASKLSLSTVRRLEQDAESVLTRNRRAAAEALQRAGIDFLPLSNGAVAVVMRADAVR